MAKAISSLRREIEELDEKLVDLLSERMALSIQMAYAKKRENQPVPDPEREKQILENIITIPHAPMEAEELKNIFQIIMDISKNVQNRVLSDQGEKI